MNVVGYLEEVLIFFQELLCNSSLLSILELCSPLIFGVHGVYSSFLLYFKVFVRNIIHQTSTPIMGDVCEVVGVQEARRGHLGSITHEILQALEGAYPKL
jgi:hypothetical protein